MPALSRRCVAFTTHAPNVLAVLDDFTDRLLRMDQGCEAIFDTVATAPDEPVLHVFAAMFCLYGQTPGAQQTAETHLVEATRLASSLNRREEAWLRGLHLWHRKEFNAAASVFESITTEWPADLLALRVAEFLYYVMGQQFSGHRFLDHTSRLSALHGHDPDFLAMHAFASELSGKIDAARRFAEQALTLCPINPWAQHALEHVLLWEGSSDEAVCRMQDWIGEWKTVSRPIHCHNAWHVAITRLDRLEFDHGFRVFDDHVWEQTPDLVVEQLDTIAFLWRAEMAGATVAPARWSTIAAHIETVCQTLFMPFSTAHYAYALARAGHHDQLESLLAATDARAQDPDAEARRVWGPVGASLVRGCAAHGRGDAASAVTLLDPVMARMTMIGGSDAQDDLFRFAYLDGLTRVGRRSDARHYLGERLSHKQPSALEAHLLGTLL